MTRYVVANWKSHKTLSEAGRWLETFCRLSRPHPDVEVIIAPASVYLVPLSQFLCKQGIAGVFLALQDLSPFPFGAYTGAVAAEMVRGLAQYAIIGHGERRRYFHETNQDVANKVSEATAANIRPIVCVDQSYAVAQLGALLEADTKDLLIGYGPMEAIGIDQPQTPEKTLRVIQKIATIMPHRPILYGGSINTTNVDAYISLPGVAGVMVGSGCQDAEAFVALCHAVAGHGMG